jgi:hypothetical protein
VPVQSILFLKYERCITPAFSKSIIYKNKLYQCNVLIKKAKPLICIAAIILYSNHSLKPCITIAKGYRPTPSLYSQVHQIISFTVIIQEQEIYILHYYCTSNWIQTWSFNLNWNNAMPIDKLLALLWCNWEVPGSNLNLKTRHPNFSFPQALYVNASVGNKCFQHPFQFIIY